MRVAGIQEAIAAYVNAGPGYPSPLAAAPEPVVAATAMPENTTLAALPGQNPPDRGGKIDTLA